MRAARADFLTLTCVAEKLSIPAADLPEASERMQMEIKRTAKLIQKQIAELAGYRAADLLRQTPVEHGMRIIRLNLTDADDASYGKLLAGKLTLASERTVALLSRCPAEEHTATIFLARSNDLNFDSGTLLRQALDPIGGRGNGSKDMAQGSIPFEHLSVVMDTLTTAIVKAES